MHDIPLIFSLYQAMHIDPWGSKIQLDSIKQILPFDLFLIYIMLLHLELMAICTNYNAENKQTQVIK